MIEIITAAMASYAIVLLVTEYDGPFNIFDRLRKFKVFRCLACLSVWVTGFIAYWMGIDITGYLAAVGLVLFVDRLTS